MHHQSIAAALLAAGSAFAAPHPQASSAPVAIKCPIVFDGRIPTNTTPTFFDTYATNTIYNPDYVKGNNLKWSQILKFPTGEASRFDGPKYSSIEVTLSDQSIFQQQNGFRRAGLQFLQDSSSGPGTVGVKTLHFSVKQDSARPLNLTHEYLVSIISSEFNEHNTDLCIRTSGTKLPTTRPTRSSSRPAKSSANPQPTSRTSRC
jgi:hypothetical protein